LIARGGNTSDSLSPHECGERGESAVPQFPANGYNNGMNIFDFIKQDELDDFPEDPSLAFMEFVRLAQQRLFAREKELDSQQDWHLIEEARHGFLNVVVAAAKRYGIEPFVAMEVPRIGQFDQDVHRQFKIDLDHYMTQLVLDSNIRGRRDTVFLPEASKGRIRSYVHGLKVEIDKGSFSEAKRADLLDKLARFERSLDNRRLNLMEVTALSIAILGLPGSVWASGEIVAKLVTNVQQVIGEAKLVDDENRRLQLVEKPAALLPPRKALPESHSAELDDEIPF
jgi:hypothetical protein